MGGPQQSDTPWRAAGLHVAVGERTFYGTAGEDYHRPLTVTSLNISCQYQRATTSDVSLLFEGELPSVIPRIWNRYF